MNDIYTPAQIMALTGTMKRLPRNKAVMPEAWHRVQSAADSLVNILDAIDTEQITNGQASAIASALGRAIEIASAHA